MNQLLILHKNIDKYQRKFYLFKILRGLIFTFSLVGFVFLILTILNYYFYFSVSSKRILFYSFLVLSLIALSEFVLIPLFKLLKILPGLDHFASSKLIANKLSGVNDLLLNVLELESSVANSSANVNLLNASIIQKINYLKVYRFSDAVLFSELKKYLKYLLFPLLVFFIVAVYNFSVISHGTDRFVNYSVLYQPQAPFSFELLNDDLAVQSGKDLELRLRIKGDYVPAEVFVSYGANLIPLIVDKKNKTEFTYTFKSVNNDFSFKFFSDNFYSSEYEVAVLPSPSINSFEIEVVPPSYTGKDKFSVSNSGDIIVPFGSKLNFHFNTANVDSLFLSLDSALYVAKSDNDYFNCSYVARKSLVYNILVKNGFFDENLLKYDLTVIPDLYPNIDVRSAVDSSIASLVYYNGVISDDYGFSSLTFNYAIVPKNDSSEPVYQQIKLNVLPSLLQQQFYYFYDFSDLDVSSDELVKYFFKVSDNDYMSNYKSVTTSIYSYFVPSLQELDSNFNSMSDKIEQNLSEAYDLSYDLQNDIEKFQQRMINEDLSSWEKQNFLENLLKKQQNLEQILDSLQKENQQKLNNLSMNKDMQEELMRKHEEIQKLIDELMTDEIKELLDELNKLRENFDEKEFDKNLDKTKLSMEDMSQELDKTQELLKRMRLEQEVQNIADRLEELAEQQKNLSESMKNDISAEKQDSALSNEFKFNKLMEQYESLMNDNKQLEKPYNLEDFDSLRQEISEDMQESKKQMFDGNKKKSSQNMQKSSQKMQKLSKQMNSMMEQNAMQQNAEDIETLRFLLSNLLSFSFDLEDLNKETKKRFSFKSEFYTNLKEQQLSLNNEFGIIEDSLRALASRNPMVGTTLTEELNKITSNLSLTNKQLEANNKNQASVSQRYALTSVNKLALMLSESLNNMNNMQSGSGSGQKKQQKPGQQNSMPNSMKSMQKSMQQQLQEMIDGMKKGKKPGSMERGQQVAKREAFQKMLQDMINSGNLSQQMKEMLQEINKLNEDIKKNILNNNITPELLQRDKQIQTRLLEVEKSENQRKFSEKRESKQGQDKTTLSPDKIEKYFNDYKLLNESFSKQIINLNTFYKIYYNDYVYRLGQ